jgi:hypothetical protein
MASLRPRAESAPPASDFSAAAAAKSLAATHCTVASPSYSDGEDEE